jgi:hypothetical protein
VAVALGSSWCTDVITTPKTEHYGIYIFWFYIFLHI